MLEVLSPGPLTTVQDGIGRPDAAALGVPRGGAADPLGLAVANLLVGNDADTAALEMTLGGPDLIVRADCLIGLGGADLGATLDGRPLVPGRAYHARTGERLSFDVTAAGAGIRGYLAVAGGIDVPIVLGSASTCLPGAFGGLDGRPLRAGDVIAARVPVAPGVTPPAPREWHGQVRSDGGEPASLRVTPGPHEAALLDALIGCAWEVSPVGSRAGIRLSGDPISASAERLASFPVSSGAVQLPPRGEPIVLLVDAPTVGGYPVIAVVASADRGAVGQLGPGDSVRFELVTEADARAAELERRRRFAALVAALSG
ncbi:MAG TPA: biotin-dependent carboxyltransferase family protein [Candidatus Limnocylindrales bacterium]